MEMEMYIETNEDKVDYKWHFIEKQFLHLALVVSVNQPFGFETMLGRRLLQINLQLSFVNLSEFVTVSGENLIQ